MIKKIEVLLALGMVILVLIFPEHVWWIVAGWIVLSISLAIIWEYWEIAKKVAPWCLALFGYLWIALGFLAYPECKWWFVASAVVSLVIVGASFLTLDPKDGASKIKDLTKPDYWVAFMALLLVLQTVVTFIIEPESNPDIVSMLMLGLLGIGLGILPLYLDKVKEDEIAKRMAKHCPNCGFQNQSDAIWCEHCGQSLGLLPPIVQRAWKVVVLALVALVVGILCARFFLGREIEPVSGTPVGSNRTVQSLARAKVQTTPTATPRPTVTPTPTVNPNQQPPPGTVLYAGQGVTKRDLNLKIGELETVDEGYTRDTFFSTTVPYFGFFFYATNHGQERLLLRYDPAAVHISDDVGTVYTHQALDVEQYWIEPGATKEFGPRWEEAYMCKHQGNIIDGCLMGRNSLFRGPINPRAKSLFITIDYLEDMKNITWRYDLVPTK